MVVVVVEMTHSGCGGGIFVYVFPLNFSKKMTVYFRWYSYHKPSPKAFANFSKNTNIIKKTPQNHQKPPQATISHHKPPQATTSHHKPPQATTSHHKPPQATTNHQKPLQAPTNHQGKTSCQYKFSTKT